MPLRKPVFLVTAFLAMAAGVGLAAEASGAGPLSVESSECQNCHNNPSMTKTMQSGETLSLYVDDSAYAQSVHGGVLSCQTCHEGYNAFPHPGPAAQDLNEYRASQKTACKFCHREQYAQLEGSVHGTLKGKGLACIDCHSTHEIREPEVATLRATSLALCTGCHQDERLMSAYGMSTSAVTTYLQDFHGRTSLLKTKQGEAWIEEAVCADCHGAHNVARVEADNSQVVRANLTATCQKCHTGATPNFPDSWMSHYEASPTKAPLVFLAQAFYWIMIPFTIGGLLMHIGVDLAHRVRRKKAA